MTYQSRNPATGKLLKSYDEATTDEISNVLVNAQQQFQMWRQTSFGQRADGLKSIAELLKEESADLGRLMAEEMGKPVRQGRAEAEKCAWVCRYYAEHAEAFLQSESISTELQQSFVVYQPLGTVLAIMPWNFPFWQLFRFAAPALMAGNTVIMKHASNVPQCAEAIAHLFRRSEVPTHVFQNLMVSQQQVPEIIRHPAIAAVTLTGSTRAGSSVARAAGESLKKSVLELGGSDPYLILSDADLDKAVPICVGARMVNSGQSCIAAKRFIAVGHQRQRFERLLVEAMEQQTMGDPLDEKTDLGPLARPDLRDTLHKQVQDSVQQGAQCLLGGELPEGDGAYYPPTVLSNVRPGMPAFDEELFGPVAAVVPASDDKEAVQLANKSVYGLGAAVFAEDTAAALRLAEHELEAGCCFVNAAVRSDPRLPFGGIKQSGYGRELSHHGIREFVNAKTVGLG